MNTRPERQVLRASNGKLQLKIEKVIAEAAAVTAGYTRTVRIPSARLTCTIELFWDTIRLTSTNQIASLLSTGAAAAIATASNSGALVAVTDPISRGGDNPLFISMDSGALHTILPFTTLPFAYELVTGVPMVNVLLGITAPTVNGNPIYPSWAIRARYEPNMEIDDQELQLLWAECDIS